MADPYDFLRLDFSLTLTASSLSSSQLYMGSCEIPAACKTDSALNDSIQYCTLVQRLIQGNIQPKDCTELLQFLSGETLTVQNNYMHIFTTRSFLPDDEKSVVDAVRFVINTWMKGFLPGTQFTLDDNSLVIKNKRQVRSPRNPDGYSFDCFFDTSVQMCYGPNKVFCRDPYLYPTNIRELDRKQFLWDLLNHRDDFDGFADGYSAKVFLKPRDWKERFIQIASNIGDNPQCSLEDKLLALSNLLTPGDVSVEKCEFMDCPRTNIFNGVLSRPSKDVSLEDLRSEIDYLERQANGLKAALRLMKKFCKSSGSQNETRLVSGLELGKMIAKKVTLDPLSYADNSYYAIASLARDILAGEVDLSTFPE